MNKPLKRFVMVLPSLLFAVASLPPAHGQSRGVDIDQELVRYAAVQDPRLVKFFADDFMITEPQVERLLIYDITGDGFGEGDLARTYPGGRIYLLTPGKKAQRIMNGWTFGNNIQFTAHLSDSPETFEHAPDSVRALGGIFAGLLRGLRRNYKGVPFKVYMEQLDGVAAIEMWDYDRRLLKYTPPPVTNREVLKPVYNLIYLEKSISDTVYYGSRGDGQIQE